MSVNSGGLKPCLNLPLKLFNLVQAYIKPSATGTELLFVSRTAVCVAGIGIVAFSCFIFKVFDLLGNLRSFGQIPSIIHVLQTVTTS